MKSVCLSMLAGVSIALSGCATLPHNESVLTTDPVAISDDYPPSIEELSFESHGQRLNGLFYLANGEGPHPTVILLHGYPGNEKNLDLAQTLRRDGFNVMFFHYRGSWGSEGEFGFTNVIEDVQSALDFVRDNANIYRVDPDHLILIGHSMGGFAALHGAANDKDVTCAVGLAPADMARIPDISKEVTSGFMLWSDSLQMLKGWTGEKAVTELTEKKEAFLLGPLTEKLSDKSVLLTAGDKDTSVPPAMVQAVSDIYAQNEAIDLEMVTLSGDHSFSWSRMALSQTVLDWIQQCKE